MDRARTCSEDGCENPAARGELCWRHEKQKQRGGLKHPAFGKRYPTTMDRLREAAQALADAETDDDFRRADDQLRAAARVVRRSSFSEAIQEGMAAAKARGVHVGRPANVEPRAAFEALKKHGGLERGAKALGVTLASFWRALRRFSKG